MYMGGDDYMHPQTPWWVKSQKKRREGVRSRWDDQGVRSGAIGAKSLVRHVYR
jgi:hypothetical protein